jgi:hypothetical protein
MTKPLNGVRSITIEKTLYWPKSHVLYLQFCDAFATHFSQHQFGITTKGGCETIIHGIKCTLDLHPNQLVFQLDVANAFNLVSRRVIFQELRVVGGDIIQLILSFVHSMHLNLPCFIVIVIVMVMSQSSHLSWEHVKVIFWEGHYLL